jgi:hypothetical protein
VIAHRRRSLALFTCFPQKEEAGGGDTGELHGQLRKESERSGGPRRREYYIARVCEAGKMQRSGLAFQTAAPPVLKDSDLVSIEARRTFAKRYDSYAQ